jgi:hypothetical protein
VIPFHVYRVAETAITMTYLVILPVAMLAGSLLFAGIVRRAVITGYVPAPHLPWKISRDQMPFAFWLCVSFYAFLALGAFVAAIASVIYAIGSG